MLALAAKPEIQKKLKKRKRSLIVNITFDVL